MSISRLTGQDASSGAGSSPVTATYTSVPTQGNLMIATLYDSFTNVTQVPSTVGWQKAVGIDDGSAHSISIWWKVAGGSETQAQTWTNGASGSMHLLLYEYTGAQGEWGLEHVASATSGAGTANSQTTGTLSWTIYPNQLLIAAVGFAGTASAPSWTNSFNARQATTRNQNADLIVSTTSNYNTTCTVTGTAVQMNGAIAGFVETKPSFKLRSNRPHSFSPGLAR